MESDKTFFHIEIELLQDKKIFPFHLYVYNPQSEEYSTFIHANTPLTGDKEEFLHFILDKGGEIAIDRNQKRTFLCEMGLKESDVPSLGERQLTPLEKKRLEKIEKIKSRKADNGEDIAPYDLKSGLQACLQLNNFLPMILAAKEEIEVFEVTTSHTVSLAAYLAECLLTEDNLTNRIVAFTYFMTKNMDMRNEQTLADIVCASFFCHLGYTQLDHSLSHKPEIELSDREKKKVKRHGGLSGHLLTKSKLDISDRCKNIIFEHHERYDGSGYPNQKNGEFIDTLALILGSISFLFEYSEGKINGVKQPLDSVIGKVKNNSFTAGLEFNFGDKIYENIINLTTNEDIKKAA